MRSLVTLALVVSLLAGCTEPAPVPDPSASDTPTPQVTTTTFDGQLRFPPAGDSQNHPFGAPHGTERVEGTLTWSGPAADLRFRILDDAGQVLVTGFPEEEGRAHAAARWPAGATEGTVEVYGVTGVNVAYAFELRLVANPQRHGPIQATYALGPGEFAEINLDMVPDDYFRYTWTSDATVYFDVHWHRDGQTHTEAESRDTEGTGEFTAPEEEIYSLLWANEGVATATVQADVDGIYQLHSMSR